MTFASALVHGTRVVWCEGTAKLYQKMQAACVADPAVPTTNLTTQINLLPSVQRLELGDHASLWEQLPCQDRPLKEASMLFPNRTTWREPPIGELCCLRSSGCFRAVLDARIPLPVHKFAVGDKVRYRNYASRRPVAAPGWELGRVTSVEPLRVRSTTTYPRVGRAYDEVRPWDRRDDDEEHAIVEAVRQLLVSEARLADDDVQVTTWRRQALGHSAHFLEANAFHYDYGQNAGAAFSATLYTGHDGDEELEGGWTAFVSSGSASKPDDPDVRPLTPAGETLEAKAAPDDANPGLQRHPNGSAVLSRGLVVAPRIGRLLLFSGGAENYHAPLPVGRGRRQSLQIFFGCRCKS